MGRIKCEFFLVRYVPDPIRNEFANIGVVLRKMEGNENKAVVRFTRDWTRARCLNPDVDTALLEALESELYLGLTGDVPDVQTFIGEMETSFSNAVQVTGSRGCLAESLPEEIDQLMRMYVEPRHLVTIDGPRQALQKAMRVHFEYVGIWERMQKDILAANYTAAGDPMRIDCGLPPNGVRLMVHAVSLGGDLAAAKALAYSMTAMREGVRRIEQAVLDLTAIVEPLEEVRGGQQEGDRTASYQFAVKTMESQFIRVLTTNDLYPLANSMKESFHSSY